MRGEFHLTPAGPGIGRWRGFVGAAACTGATSARPLRLHLFEEEEGTTKAHAVLPEVLGIQFWGETAVP
ncbi:hypothetical protein MQE23_02795 [Streptomyces sp. HP-A2021]|uniref:hypothetical protein n=1 Tax=Streptomyces sp. HP-A2021 TaxID=2927875 RepID=UPI001FAE7EFF|nr:hypothetical protein [Streptomyces sp. HP-A2021]UOB08058.1 hypothetical protein MQE23_02795 [Streptomyces sp. HP-A2021]